VDINLLDFINIDLGQEDDTIVFMAIAIVVALLLVLTFLLGEVFEFFGDAVNIDDGGGIFNMQSIAAFLAGFGAIAWLLTSYFNVPSLVAAASGVAAGIPIAGSFVLMTRAFMLQSASSGFVLSESHWAAGTRDPRHPGTWRRANPVRTFRRHPHRVSAVGG
jgi:hypothetical protein